jgi:tetratricopeptide (TPR) repeat protein
VTGSSIHSKADRLYVCLGLLLLVPSGAWCAQTEAEKESAARSRFVEATKQYNLGQFDQALKEYKAVYELKPHPGLLFNIAQCYRRLEDFSAAAFYYRRYRDEAHLSGADAELVNGLIAEVEDKQAKRDAHERELEITRAATKLAADQAALKAATEKLAAEEQQKSAALIGPTPQDNRPTLQDNRDTIFTKWWFWTAAGVLVTSASIYYALPVHPRNTSLGEIGVRVAR